MHKKEYALFMIGRKKELQELEELYHSGRPELVAIYGRRRVGKTYLVNEALGNDLTFRHTGLSPAELKGEGMLNAELYHFHISLKEYGLKEDKCPGSWMEAFYLLRKLLTEKDDGNRQVVFIDEFPWLDTPRSGFITGFESFWNGWGSSKHNLMVIVCGSATSWMKNKLINNYGGLYGRVTYEIFLSQFNLCETELFFRDRGVGFSRYDIAESYMITGGIPYYLGYYRKHLSLAQNIDEMFFKPHAKLKDEYEHLFNSIFVNPDRIRSIVGLLGSRNLGYTRKEISEELGISNNGQLSEDLEALISSDFIIKYVPFGYSGKQEHYKLMDQFCLFCLRFVKKKKNLSQDFWKENVSSSEINSWRGYAFENVCFNHIEQIKAALKISGIGSRESSWTHRDKEGAEAQIDLLISRKDNVVNMCEIKFLSNVFTVDKKHDLLLRNRQSLLRERIPKKSSVQNTLITTYGIRENEYRWSFDNIITLDDLFAD